MIVLTLLRMSEYVWLRAQALKDKDPYVRKTAAICVAKLYDINKDLVEEQGFLQTLREMISDGNSTVQPFFLSCSNRSARWMFLIFFLELGFSFPFELSTLWS